MATTEHEGTTPAARAADLVPIALLAPALVVLLVVKGALVVETLQHPRAIAMLAALVGAWLLLSRVVLPRFVADTARLLVMTAFAVTIVWLLVAPYLFTTRVDEPIPADVPSAPLTTGTLRGLAHDAIGNASVYQAADGRLFVGLESIDVDPGPDLHAYLVPREGARDRTDGVHLGRLRGTEGTQYFEIDADTAPDVTNGATVLVWCRVFGFAVAHAPQTAL